MVPGKLKRQFPGHKFSTKVVEDPHSEVDDTKKFKQQMVYCMYISELKNYLQVPDLYNLYKFAI